MNFSKMVFFIGGLCGGGSEKICVNLANSLAQKNWKITIVVCSLNNEKYLKDISNKVEVVNLDIRPRYALFKIFNYLRLNKTSVCLAFSHEIAILLILNKIIMRSEIKIIARNINSLKEINKSTKNMWNKWIVMSLVKSLYQKIDFCINQCKKMQDEILEWFPKLKNKTTYIYNPITPVIYGAVPLNLPDNYILCVGRLEKQKGFDYAINAFYKVKKNLPDLKLVIVGQGSLSAELKAQTEKLNLTESVIFWGFTSELGHIYANAKATILTSLHEGFPNVLIESLYCGTPLIAFDCPTGPSEIVIDGVNGYLVKYMDTNDLSGKIEMALKEKLNRDCVSRTAERFSPDRIIDEYQNVFRNVMALERIG